MIFDTLKLIGRLISYFNYKKDRFRLKNIMNNGLLIGKNVYIGENVFFDYNYPFLIEIGDNCRITTGTRILAHDATIFRELGINRIAPVKILEGTFIGADVIILPGVTIGPHAMIAAGSVVNRNIGEDKIAAGNPARPYGSFSDLITKYQKSSKDSPIFKKSDIESKIVSVSSIRSALQNNTIAFIQGVPKNDPYYINADYKKIRAHANNLFESFSKLNTK